MESEVPEVGIHENITHSSYCLDCDSNGKGLLPIIEERDCLYSKCFFLITQEYNKHLFKQKKRLVAFSPLPPSTALFKYLIGHYIFPFLQCLFSISAQFRLFCAPSLVFQFHINLLFLKIWRIVLPVIPCHRLWKSKNFTIIYILIESQQWINLDYQVIPS